MRVNRHSTLKEIHVEAPEFGGGVGNSSQEQSHSSHKLGLPMWHCALVGLNNPTHTECPNEKYMSKAHWPDWSLPLHVVGHLTMKLINSHPSTSWHNYFKDCNWLSSPFMSIKRAKLAYQRESPIQTKWEDKVPSESPHQTWEVSIPVSLCESSPLRSSKQL